MHIATTTRRIRCSNLAILEVAQLQIIVHIHIYCKRRQYGTIQRILRGIPFVRVRAPHGLRVQHPLPTHKRTHLTLRRRIQHKVVVVIQVHTVAKIADVLGVQTFFLLLIPFTVVALLTLFYADFAMHLEEIEAKRVVIAFKLTDSNALLLYHMHSFMEYSAVLVAYNHGYIFFCRNNGCRIKQCLRRNASCFGIALEMAGITDREEIASHITHLFHCNLLPIQIGIDSQSSEVFHTVLVPFSCPPVIPIFHFLTTSTHSEIINVRSEEDIRLSAPTTRRTMGTMNTIATTR